MPRHLRAGERLVIASHNPGKVAEIEELLRPYGVAAIGAGALGLPEPEETGASFEANAALKARAEEVTRLRADNKPTVPTLLGEEKKANVFLRADEPSVAAGVRMKGRSAAEVFGELRERKNKS